MMDDKTHFIGVLPPSGIERVVSSDRKWTERYGCRSGHSTPVHVTLVPPFSSTKSTDEIKDILKGILPLLWMDMEALVIEPSTSAFCHLRSGIISLRLLQRASRPWERG